MAILCACAARAASSVPDTARNAITVVQWNVENLFDTVDDPDNEADDPFTPEGWRRWTEYRYRTKLKHLARVLAEIKGDILCLEEIENMAVLEALTDVLRKKHGLAYGHIIHREGPDHRGIDVAIVSNIAPVSRKWVPPVPEQRDILIVGFEPSGYHLTIFANHWKSRWGKAEETARIRMKQAKTAGNEIGQILSRKPGSAVMLVGDFNDDYDGPPLVEGVRSVSSMDRVLADNSEGLLYNLHGGLAGEARGTFFYRRAKRWNSFDSMSVSRAMVDHAEGATGWKIRPGSYEVFSRPYMLDEEKSPKSFRRITDKATKERIYQYGYSDHLPVRVVVELRATP